MNLLNPIYGENSVERMIYVYNICDEMVEVFDVKLAATEQHIDMRTARVFRDTVDVKKIID